MRFAKRPSVAVIGAGIGGLTSAISLAAEGVDVDVYEALSTPGGKANIATHDGVEFDTGPTLVTLPDVFDEVFRRAGTTLAREVSLINGQRFRYRFPTGPDIDICDDLIVTAANIERARGPAASREFLRFIGYATRIWNSAAPHFVYGPSPTVSTVVSSGLANVGDLLRIDPLRSMKRSIDAQVDDPCVRNILYRYATYNGSDVRKAPATLNCIAGVELVGGGFGVKGGIYALIRALVHAARRLNVSVHTSTSIQRVRCSQGRATGVVVGGELRPYDAIVVNADYSHLREHLLDGEESEQLDAPPPPSMSGHTFVVRTRRQSGRAAHEVLFPKNYDREFSAIFDEGCISDEPAIYVCSMEQAHGRTGWEEDEALFVMINAPSLGAEPRAVGQKVHSSANPTHGARGIFDAIQRRLHAAGVLSDSATVVWQRSAKDLACQFPGTGGAIYGGSSNGALAAFNRPANRLASIPGLFACGGSVHPGGGLPLCALSGLQAACEARAFLGLPSPMARVSDRFVRLERGI